MPSKKKTSGLLVIQSNVFVSEENLRRTQGGEGDQKAALPSLLFFFHDNVARVTKIHI